MLYILYLNAFFKRFYLLIFRQRGRKGERGMKHQRVVVSCTPATGNLTQNPGMCPDWESNRDPLVRWPALNPLSYTSQGTIHFFFKTQDH